MDARMGIQLISVPMTLSSEEHRLEYLMENSIWNQRKRFEFIEGLITNFWKRWHTHYFENLILRQKWNVEHRNLRVGDIVLVPDSKSLRGNWKPAEVSRADPGSDGKVRDVELRYKIQDDSEKYTGVNDTKIKRL